MSETSESFGHFLTLRDHLYDQLNQPSKRSGKINKKITLLTRFEISKPFYSKACSALFIVKRMSSQQLKMDLGERLFLRFVTNYGLNPLLFNHQGQSAATWVYGHMGDFNQTQIFQTILRVRANILLARIIDRPLYLAYSPAQTQCITMIKKHLSHQGLDSNLFSIIASAPNGVHHALNQHLIDMTQYCSHRSMIRLGACNPLSILFMPQAYHQQQLDLRLVEHACKVLPCPQFAQWAFPALFQLVFNSGIPEETKGPAFDLLATKIEQTLAIFDPYVIPETYLAALEQADETTPSVTLEAFDATKLS